MFFGETAALQLLVESIPVRQVECFDALKQSQAVSVLGHVGLGGRVLAHGRVSMGAGVGVGEQVVVQCRAVVSAASAGDQEHGKENRGCKVFHGIPP